MLLYCVVLCAIALGSDGSRFLPSNTTFRLLETHHMYIIQQEWSVVHHNLKVGTQVGLYALNIRSRILAFLMNSYLRQIEGSTTCDSHHYFSNAIFDPPCGNRYSQKPHQSVTSEPRAAADQILALLSSSSTSVNNPVLTSRLYPRISVSLLRNGCRFRKATSSLTLASTLPAPCQPCSCNLESAQNLLLDLPKCHLLNLLLPVWRPLPQHLPHFLIRNERCAAIGVMHNSNSLEPRNRIQSEQ